MKIIWILGLFINLFPFSVSGQAIVNPVLNQNFPDPTVIRANGRYYAYATNSSVNGKFVHIQVASSTDLQHWNFIGDALPDQPVWAEKDFWAPHVLYDTARKKYVMFFSAESKAATTGKCIGVAFSDLPEGPFIDKGTPLICGKDFVNIDPFAFTDPKTGKKLLYWGSDFEPIKVQQLSDDWQSFEPGSSTKSLIFPGREKLYDKLIEGAWVDYQDGQYYLYYSGDNCCGANAHYAVMVARAEQATGPFKTLGEARGNGNSVILEQNSEWLAPGHNSIFCDDMGNKYIAYHAIKKESTEKNGRVFCINPIRYQDGWPVVDTLDKRSNEITWGQTIVINNDPVDPNIKGQRGSYGSQYGRMLKLSNGKWLAAYTVSRNAGYEQNAQGGFAIEIAESTDQGKHWKPISLVAENGRDVDNAAFIQLPDQSILLGCRSVRWQESYRLPVFKSNDNGHTWKKISTIDENEGRPGELGKPDKGVYEPHFYILDDGRLGVMYANEKHVSDSISYSQIISEKISADMGKTWGKEIWVAYEPGHHASRPGMPVWTKMKNNEYIVVYEICGPEACNIYYKKSDDGINWPIGLGTPIADQTGAPYILSLADGTLVLTSNRGNISLSKDFGEHWYTEAARPWRHQKSYEADWTQTIWSSMYQVAVHKIAIITTIKRQGGGDNVQMRFGDIKLEQNNNLVILECITQLGKGDSTYIQQIAPGPIGSLLFALCIMFFCWLVGFWLDKRKIYIRI